MSGLGPKRKSRAECGMSALPQIVLKKSFLAEQQKFLGPLMHFVRGDVRDHIDSPKIDHELA